MLKDILHLELLYKTQRNHDLWPSQNDDCPWKRRWHFELRSSFAISGLVCLPLNIFLTSLPRLTWQWLGQTRVTRYKRWSHRPATELTAGSKHRLRLSLLQKAIFRFRFLSIFNVHGWDPPDTWTETDSINIDKHMRHKLVKSTFSNGCFTGAERSY